MATYAIPEIETPTRAAAKEVLLIASGDLRQSANQVCWPAQAQMEEKLIAAFDAEGIHVAPCPPLRCREGPRLHLQPAHGHGCLRRHRPRRAAGLRRGRVAVHPSCAAGPAQPSRAHPHRRQLVGPVAGPGRHAQSQRLARTRPASRSAPCGARTSTTSIFRDGLREWLRKATRHPRSDPRASTSILQQPARAEERSLGEELAAAAASAQGHPRRLRRRLHGHVQRHHRRRAAEPAGRLQGAAQPVRAGRRACATVSDAEAQTVREWLDAQRHDLQHRHG